MEELLKNWKLRMVNYRQEADNAKTPITRVKAMNKFFILRDCIKELEQKLTLTNVVGQSEQLCDCDAPLIRTSDKGGEYCGICERDLD